MISFSEFLAESRSAPLYHATNYTNLGKILASGINGETFQTIHRGTKTAYGRYGVSTSRSLIKAIKFYYDDKEYRNSYVVLVLDQEKINRHYKVVPVDYFQTLKMVAGTDSRLRRHEDEEFIIIPPRRGTLGFLPSSYIKQVMYINPSAADSPHYGTYIQVMKEKFPKVNWVEIKK